MIKLHEFPKPECISILCQSAEEGHYMWYFPNVFIYRTMNLKGMLGKVSVNSDPVDRNKREHIKYLGEKNGTKQKKILLLWLSFDL